MVVVVRMVMLKEEEEEQKEEGEEEEEVRGKVYLAWQKGCVERELSSKCQTCVTPNYTHTLHACCNAYVHNKYNFNSW